MWANPKNLKHLKEEKKTEHTFDNQMKAVESKQIKPVEKFSEASCRILAFLRQFKTSNRSYSYK